MSRRDHKEGFVLIAALAAVMIASLWAASAVDRIQQAIEAASGFEAESKAQLEGQEAIAAAAFLFATSPASVCGLQPAAPYVASDFFNTQPASDAPCLRLDGRPVEVAGYVVELQDAGGLVSVRLPNPDLIKTTTTSEVDAIASLDLAETLADYGDLNDEPFAGGAEAGAYVRSGRRPPPNLWPRTPYEAFDALGWSAFARPEVADRLSIALQASLNINTARAEQIAVLAPLTATDAEAIVAARERLGFSTYDQIAAATGGRAPDNPFSVSFLPSSTLRVRVFPPSGPGMIEASLTRPGRADAPPWSLDYILWAPHRLGYVERRANGAGLSSRRADRYGPWLRP